MEETPRGKKVMKYVFPLIKDKLEVDELISMFLSDGEMIFSNMNPSVASFGLGVYVAIKRLNEINMETSTKQNYSRNWSTKSMRLQSIRTGGQNCRRR